MYQPSSLLDLFVKMHRKELIEWAERTRLIKLSRQNRPAHRSFGLKIITWTMAQISARQQGKERTNDVLSVSNPCCTGAEL